MDKHRVSRQLFLSSSLARPVRLCQSGTTSGVGHCLAQILFSFVRLRILFEREREREKSRRPGMEEATATGAISHKDHRARGHSWAIGMWPMPPLDIL